MTDRAVPVDDSVTWNARSPALSGVQTRVRKREILVEQHEDWVTGSPAPAEDYLARWPTDPKEDPDAASVLIAEFFQRRERGEQPRVSDYEERFPEHSPALRHLMLRQNLLRSVGGKHSGVDALLRLPAEGDVLFGFRLRQPLGCGAFAEVYLAEQPDLACRPVVLKLSDSEGTEPQTLARLQHTNIVPIYSVHEDRKAGLRAVCMPYFGGASLSSVLQRLWSESARPTQGAQLVAALEAVGFPSPEALSREAATAGGENREPAPLELAAESQTPLALLRSLGYLDAVAWIVAQLAEGLHHAHQRGVLHRDIKPSNILLDAEGLPLLLDFNVAQELTCATAHAILGGTVAYAAPEHLRALMAGTSDLIRLVDQRSDIYSLGLVLAEMITGARLFEQGGSYSVRRTQLEAMAEERRKIAPSLRQMRADVPWSLESIARKCLDPDPARRYQRAGHLAEDLRRFLEDRPLRYAPELSSAEQIQKFFRRHPRLTTSSSIAVAAVVTIVAIGSALLGARQHLDHTRARLAESRARERKRTHDSNVARALCLVNTTLGHQDHLRQGIALCEKTLALYASPDGKPSDRHPDWERLAPTERAQVLEDRRELLLLLAGARVRLAPGDRQTLRRALALLDEAEAIRGLGPSKALWLDRARYWSRLGESAKAEQARMRAQHIRATAARDHYLLAISHARQGGTDGYRSAVAELDEALRLNPRHYWSAIQRGICHMELGESVLAVGDFGTCIGLWPDHPWGFYNRGYALDRDGMKAEAVADYTAALNRDPDFVAALVNRGLARLELKEYRAALADFERARALTDKDASLHAGRGIALEAFGRHAEADAAFRESFARSSPPDPTYFRLRWTYGFAVSARLPREAQKAFDDVLRHDPRHPQALYGCAMLAMDDGNPRIALQFLDRALEADLHFLEARRYRAILLARQGDWDRSTRDINWCLEREPRSGETLYAAACVAARAAAASRSSDAIDRAFALLQRALALGSGRCAHDDPDLAGLRQDPRFDKLVTKPSDAESLNSSVALTRSRSPILPPPSPNLESVK
jgi:serine/threonine protein kinase/Flp pilus assembly protein TadD